MSSEVCRVDMASYATLSKHVHEDEDMPPGKLLAPALDQRHLLGLQADRPTPPRRYSGQRGFEGKS